MTVVDNAKSCGNSESRVRFKSLPQSANKDFFLSFEPSLLENSNVK